MSSNIYTAGLNNVGSYQVSGAPYATGSLTSPAAGSTPISIQFPYVTQWVKVIPITGSVASHLRIGFSENGVKNGNYYRLFAGQNANHEAVAPEPIRVKVSELYFCSDNSATIEFDVVAGLTNIPTARVDNIGPSGSNWSGSIGVG